MTPTPPSVRAVGAIAPFGLRPGITPHPGPTLPPCLTGLLPGSIAVVAGPSGSGKSRTLHALADHLRARNRPSPAPVVGPGEPPLDPATCVIDALASPLDDAIGLLARAGLAEARLFAAPIDQLSEGERHRLSLAVCMERALSHQGTWLLIDECASVLDRQTAASVCATLARWVRRVGVRAGVRLVCASAHEDLPRLLGADVIVRCAPTGDVSVAGRARTKRVKLSIERGTREDYRALAPLHYRAGVPATRAAIRRCVRTIGRERRLAGVLVVSMPTLNGSWRDLAWPGRYTSGDKRARARRINRELRCLSRVIVDPRDRGLGVGRLLVESYLHSPLTPATEAVAAMGSACPFFERAGMTAYRTPPSEADARWLDALASVGATPARAVIDPASVAAAGWVVREARRWCRAMPGVRTRLDGMTDGEMVRTASMGVLAKPIAYAASA